MADHPPSHNYIEQWRTLLPGTLLLIKEIKNQMIVERPAIVIKSFPSKIDVLKLTNTPNTQFDFFQFQWNDRFQNCRLIYADMIKAHDFDANKIIITDYRFPTAVRKQIFGYLRLHQLCVEQKIDFNQIRQHYDRILAFIKTIEQARSQESLVKEK